MWKKILYFSVAVILGMVFYTMIYAANLSEYKLAMVDSAIQKEDYHIVPQIFLEVPFDTKSILEENDDDATVKIYPAAGMVNYTLVDGENTKTYARYENAYLIFIFEVDFPMAGYVDSGNNSINPTAIQFVGDRGVFDYYLVLNDTYNKDKYIKAPKDETEYSLYSTREIISVYSDWNFMPISLSETTIKAIEEKTGTITSFKLIDAMGEVKMEENISFSFNEGFFSNEYIKSTKDKVTISLEKYYAETDSNTKKEIAEEVNGYLADFKENFQENTKDTGYAITLPESILTPSAIYWKTIAYLGLYAVLIIMFYFVLFHFRQISDFIKGILGRNNKNLKNYKGNKKTGPYIVKKDPVKEEKKTDVKSE